MASEIVADEDNPMLKKKDPPKKKDPLWDFSDIPSSVHPSEMLEKQKEPTKWWQFWKKDGVHPYVRTRDLNNPEGDDGGRHPRQAVEIGIKGTF